MVREILVAITLIFAVCGICEFIYIIKMFFIYPGVRTRNYSIIVLQKDYSIEQLNYIYQKIKWNGDEFSSGIVAFTDLLEQNEIDMCNKFISCNKIYLCNSKEFLDSEYVKGRLFNG